MSSRFKKRANPAPPQAQKTPGPTGGKSGRSANPLVPKKRPGPPPKVALGPPSADARPLVDDPAVTPPFSLKDEREPVGAVPGTMIPVRTILENCANMFSTTRELAAVLGISEPTLFAFFEREPEARAIWDSGKEVGKFALRRKLFTLADKSAPVAIFLGMNHLDLVDKRFIGLKGQIDHTVSPFGQFLKEIDDGRHGKMIEHDPSEKV